jgi:hypothetical protein
MFDAEEIRMNKTSFLAVLLFACSVCTCACAADKLATGLTSTDKPNRFNLRYDSAPLKTVLADVTKQIDVNIVASADSLKDEVTCNLTDVELMPAIKTLIEGLGYVFREQVPGSGVYTIRHRTPEEQRAASLKRFFDALQREGFTEDQAMQILLRSLNEEEDD